MFPMSDILPNIRILSKNELDDLGNSEAEQNETIYRFMNVSMEKRARQAYIEEFSDPLTIAGDGDYTFKRGGVDIDDLYEPLSVHVATKYGKGITPRTNFESTIGWRRESPNQPIDIRGITGEHVLKYLRYPKPITASSDVVEFPRAAKMDLIMDVVALCKLPKNYYQEYDAIKKEATGTATVKAAISAKGTNSSPPSLLDREG